MLLEKRLDKKFGLRADYLAYKVCPLILRAPPLLCFLPAQRPSTVVHSPQRGTSVLVPWPPLDLGLEDLGFEFPAEDSEDEEYLPGDDDEDEDEDDVEQNDDDDDDEDDPEQIEVDDEEEEKGEESGPRRRGTRR